MKLSTKSRYALRMMLDLAEHKNDGYIALKDIAGRQNISKIYLEQIISILNQSNFLRSTRGYKGGHMLARSPENYTVGEILRATEGSLCPVACLEDNPNQCERNSFCSTLPVWQGLGNVITKYLDGITLQDILDNSGNQGANEYYI